MLEVHEAVIPINVEPSINLSLELSSVIRATKAKHFRAIQAISNSIFYKYCHFAYVKLLNPILKLRSL